jgi:hypothetical protein
LIELTLDHIQRREDHWAIIDLVGKAGHVRTVPMPDWVKRTGKDKYRKPTLLIQTMPDCSRLRKNSS